MEKKGAGSIEFILAFVLFAGFSAAALYFFNPSGGTKNLDYSRDYTMRELIENVSVKLEIYSVILTGNEPRISMRFSGINPLANVYATDYYGNKMPAWRNGEYVCIERDNNEDFSTIYFSEDLPYAGDSPNCPQSEKYKIASSLSNKVISENKILALNKSYNSDYILLKRQLKIPEDTDFSFLLEFQDTSKIGIDKTISVTRSILSETDRVEVLKTNGNVQFGRLTVKVW
ncbi:hypothetical protein J4229_02840 [Candidatus Pacearchaeota archaeon]|nr:hypothetical protein [Candidatus Pacearchaeota archaeon]